MDSPPWPAPGAGRQEVARLASEQATLHRVATLVAKAAAPEDIFAAVAEELAKLSGASIAVVLRYETEDAATVLGFWSDTVAPACIGTRLAVSGEGIAMAVLRSGRPMRATRFAGSPGSVAGYLRSMGVRAAIGSPVIVDRQLWGVVITGTTRPERLRLEDEHRISGFAELVGTAIASAQARVELRAIAEEQAELRRVATLVARGEPPRVIFEAVAREVGQLLPADLTLIGRYEEGLATGVAGWSRSGEPVPVREQVSLSGRSVTGEVLQTGRPARMDSYADADAADGIPGPHRRNGG